MSGTYTGNLNLYNPSLGELGWKAEWDTNFSILDTAIGTYINADGSFKPETAESIPFSVSGFTATNIKDAILEAATGGISAVWGTIAGTLSDQNDLQNALNAKLNTTATTADISDSTDARYVTDSQLVAISNLSGANTGDQTKITETLTLTAGNISNKYIDLSNTPLDASAVGVFPVGGIRQLYNIDFSIITNGSTIRRLNWDGLGLESLLAEGDIIEVDYMY